MAKKKDDTSIAAYVRVSSKQQRTDSQRAEIARWLKAHHIPAKHVHWFEDLETGTTLKRPAFDELQQAIFAGRIRTVIIYKLDRLSRRQRDGINLLADWTDRGIRVVSITQQIDLSGPVGRMVAAVMFGLAEIELDYRRERQAAGIAIAKKRGVYQGRAAGSSKANPSRARQLSVRGLAPIEIATALNVSERTGFRYLSRSPSPKNSLAIPIPDSPRTAIRISNFTTKHPPWRCSPPQQKPRTAFSLRCRAKVWL